MTSRRSDSPGSQDHPEGSPKLGQQENLLGAKNYDSLLDEDPAVLYIYITHFLSTFGDRMWQFAVPMLLTQLWANSLFSQALFTLLVALSCFLLMPYVGNYIDVTPRLQALQVFIVAEAIAITVSGMAFLLLAAQGVSNNSPIVEGDQSPSMPMNGLVIGSLSVLLLGSAFAELMARGGTIALEKDWLVVIAKGDSERQTQLNKRMRRIDLICKFLGPMFFGILCPLGGTPEHSITVGVLIVVFWNIFAAPAEYKTMMAAYERIPELANLKEAPAEGRRTPLQNIASGWQSYLSHPILLASLGYCQLYMTTLSDHDAIGAAYLEPKFAWVLLAGSRGIGAVMGLLGTVIFPHLKRYVGSLERAGVISVWAFFVVLLPIGLTVMIAPDKTPYVMVVCVVLSRAALWSFDLAVQQIMQERIAESERGAVNGVHAAVCQLEYVAIAVCGLIFNSREDFKVLVLLSIGSVGLGATLFTTWYRRSEISDA